MHRQTAVLGLSLVAVLLLDPASRAQVGNPWLSFTKQPGQLALPGTALSDSDTQVQLRTGDLDLDGWDDVVAVRKQQASQPGKRVSYLLMNLNGVLTDMTASLAQASDVANDHGFLTPLNTVDAALGDVNGDGWPDVVTAVGISTGAPKAISHPRVYLNLGDDAGGAWLGLRFENARIPQLMSLGGPPLPAAPDFGGLALGDVNGDGALDAYFVDADVGFEGTGGDANDRLLLNDGSGFFVDATASTLVSTGAQVSSMGTDARITDVNGDGAPDLVKVDSPAGGSKSAKVIYNDPSNLGHFSGSVQDLGGVAPCGVALGNLNHDALPDVVLPDVGADVFRLGTGLDAQNHLALGAPLAFTFLSGGDDGLANNAYVRDLDGDGWNDVLVTDVGFELSGCGRRLHIYHNTGTVAGQQDVVLKEEIEQAGSAGWKGVVGLSADDAKGCYDVGFGDFDRDGDVDLLVATCNGTAYYENETNPLVPVCQHDLGFAGPGNVTLSLCGGDLTHAGTTAALELSGALSGQPLWLPLALSATPTPFKGGLLVPVPVLVIVSGLVTDGSGHFATSVPGSAGAPLHLILQAVVKHGGGYDLSNALDVLIGT